MMSSRKRWLLAALLMTGQIAITHVAVHAPRPLLIFALLVYIIESVIIIGVLFYLLQMETK